jgi:hypothetical protein
METLRVNVIHIFRPNQEQLQEMQLYIQKYSKPSGRDRTRNPAIPATD